MANVFNPLEAFSFRGTQEVYNPFNSYQIEGEPFKGKQDFPFPTHENKNIDYAPFDYSFDPKNYFPNGANQQSFSEPALDHMDMMIPDMDFPENPTFSDPLNNNNNSNNPMELPISKSSLELLKRYTTDNKSNGQDLGNFKIYPSVRSKELSTEEVIRVAGTRYIQISDHNEELDPLMLRYQFSSMFLTLTVEDSKDVELVHSLLASAEKIGTGLYDRASKMLLQCEYLSSSTGNPIQRLVYYFSDALRERIEIEMGRASSKEKNHLKNCIDDDTLCFHPSFLALHQALPFSQVIQFTQTQIILDVVGSSKRIHIIDLAIRTGMHWIVLMQALSVRAEPPLELLKITAVGDSRGKLSEIGKRLATFAETLNLPFTFNMVISEIEDLKEEMFGVDGSESIAVYAPTVFRRMIKTPHHLEHLMKVIRNLSPLVMSVAEIEANHNSPSFVDRFIEALFFCGAYFDALDACMDRQNKDRMFMESMFLAAGVRNMIAAEGSERMVRNVEIDVWRSFIMRFGFAEMGLSQLSVYQAGLLVGQSAFGGSCTLDKKGKALTIGWKGTPLHSVSAWKCC